MAGALWMHPGLLAELKAVSGCVETAIGMETFVPRKINIQGGTWVGLKGRSVKYLHLSSWRKQLRSVDLLLGAASLGILDPIRGVAVCVDSACSNTTCSLCCGGVSYCGAELNIDQTGTYTLSGCPGLCMQLKDCEAFDQERFMLLSLEGTVWVLRVGPDADRKVRELSGMETEPEAAAECLPSEMNNELFTFKLLNGAATGRVSNKVLFEEMCTAVEQITRTDVREVMVLRDVDHCGSHYGFRMVHRRNNINIVSMSVLPADVMPVDDASFTQANWNRFRHTARCKQAGKAFKACAEGGEFAVASDNGRLVMIRMK